MLCVAFSPDGKKVAVGGGKLGNFPGEVRLWDWENNKMLIQLTGSRQFVRQVAFSPEGRWLAAVGGSSAVADGVPQWDLESELAQITLRGHSAEVCSATLSRDGKVLATGSFDKTIRLWDTSNWMVKAILTGHTGSVRGIAFAPNGESLASASEDGTVRLWDVVKGKQKKCSREIQDRRESSHLFAGWQLARHREQPRRQPG